MIPCINKHYRERGNAAPAARSFDVVRYNTNQYARGRQSDARTVPREPWAQGQMLPRGNETEFK
jgi:hypothetical protein